MQNYTDDPYYVPKTGYLPEWGNITYCDRERTEVYHYITKGSAAITLPIDFVGFYFILKKSPKEMGNYKWLLLGHQVCITLLDIHLTVLIVPEFLFPIWGTKMHGFFDWIGVPAWVSAGLALAQLGSVLASVSSLFYYRMQVILPFFHPLKHSSKTQIIFGVINFIVNMALPAHYSYFIPSDQLNSKRDWFKMRKCVAQPFFDPNTYVLEYAPEKYYFYFLLYYMIAVCVFFVLMMSVPYYLLLFYAKQWSEATRRAQRMFLFALFVQVMVPFSLGIAPVLVYLHVRHWYFERHILNNWMLLIEALHGSSETILMLIVTAPYRRAILRPKAPAMQIDPNSNSAAVNSSLR